MKVHWTNNAIKHLLDIYEYISLDSPLYAKRIVDKITKRSEQIADFPLSGRKVQEYEADNNAAAEQLFQFCLPLRFVGLI